MRVLVTGGRAYADRGQVWLQLDAVLAASPKLEIAHGACPSKSGADWHADAWAADRGVPCRRYSPVVALDGPWPGAGPRRNRRMIDDFKPDLVVAFSGGRGTASCVWEAEKRGVRVLDLRG